MKQYDKCADRLFCHNDIFIDQPHGEMLLLHFISSIHVINMDRHIFFTHLSRCLTDKIVYKPIWIT